MSSGEAEQLFELISKTNQASASAVSTTPTAATTESKAVAKPPGSLQKRKASIGGEQAPAAKRPKSTANDKAATEHTENANAKETTSGSKSTTSSQVKGGTKKVWRLCSLRVLKRAPGQQLKLKVCSP